MVYYEVRRMYDYDKNIDVYNCEEVVFPACGSIENALILIGRRTQDMGIIPSFFPDTDGGSYRWGMEMRREKMSGRKMIVSPEYWFIIKKER